MEGLLGPAVWDRSGRPVEGEVSWTTVLVNEGEEDEGGEVKTSVKVLGDEWSWWLVDAWEVILLELERLTVLDVFEEVLKAEEMDGVDE